MTKNMTEGSPLKLILTFLVPLLIGNLLQQTYNLVDAAIVGNALGADALGAVGVSSSVQFLVNGFCIGSCAGFCIPVAQRFGAGDFKKMKEYVFHSYVFSLVLAVVMTSVCVIGCKLILALIKTPNSLLEDAYSYLVILFWGLPFVILYNIMSSLLRAVGNSRTPFIFLAISTVINIFMDMLFVIVLPLGVAGAALATILSQALSGIACAVVIAKKYELLNVRFRNSKFSWKSFGELAAVGLPMGLQYSITAIGSMVMQTANNGLGSEILVSGFTAGTKIKLFIMCPYDALGTAVANYCGQNLGAGRFDRIKKGVLETLALAVGYGILAGILLIFGGKFLSGLFVSGSETEVIAASAEYLRSIGYMYWALAFIFIPRFSTQGIGKSGWAVVSGAIEMIGRVLFSMLLVDSLGYTAICWTDQAAWVAAAMYITPAFFIILRKLEKKAGAS